MYLVPCRHFPEGNNVWTRYIDIYVTYTYVTVCRVIEL